MQRWAALVEALETADGPASALRALQAHFGAVPAADAAWGLHLLTGGRPPAVLSPAALRGLARQAIALPDWLFDDSERASGELAETVALLLPDLPGCADAPDPSLTLWMEQVLPSLRSGGVAALSAWLGRGCGSRHAAVRRIMLRQLCGARPLNMPVGQVQALLVGLGAGDPVVAARRCQAWSLRGGPPRAQDWLALCDAPGVEELQQPGPWPLAALPRLVLDAAQAEARFGPAAGWVAQAEPGPGFQQAVRRADELEWWETSFTLGSAPPQAQAAALRSAWSAGTRVLACRWPGLGTALPQTPRASDLCCADLLSHGDEDCRAWTWADRDARLRLLAQSAGLPVLPRWREDDWAALDRLRHQVVAQGGAGLRLIRSPAQAASAVAAAGASSGASADADASWVWPARVHQLPMLLVYAGEADDGSTTLTVALWNRRPRDAAEVAEVAQAISLRQAPAAGGLELLPMGRLRLPAPSADAASPDWRGMIRSAAAGRFGPVRSLRPQWVVEVSFDAVDPSRRHRAGQQLRAPVLVRLCAGLTPLDAATLDDLPNA